jgi:hypothetical protein
LPPLLYTVNGFEFFQYSPGRQAWSRSVQAAVQSHVQAVSNEGDENVSFDAILKLMIDGADRQITFEITESFLNLGQLNVKLPKPCWIGSQQIEAQQVTTFAAAHNSQLVHPQKGIRIHYFDYWSDAFHDPNSMGD